MLLYEKGVAVVRRGKVAELGAVVGHKLTRVTETIPARRERSPFCEARGRKWGPDRLATAATGQRKNSLPVVIGGDFRFKFFDVYVEFKDFSIEFHIALPPFLQLENALSHARPWPNRNPLILLILNTGEPSKFVEIMTHALAKLTIS